MKQIVVVICSMLLLASCVVDREGSIPEPPPAKDYTEIDKTIIETYLQENEIVVQTTSEGLYYDITKQGEGVKITTGSIVKAYYKGYFVDNSVFDESEPEGILFEDLTNLIPGFRDGLLLLNNGGEATFFIPSRLGYGNSFVRSIPANTVLVFDVKVFEVK